MKHTKKILSLALALVMALSLCTITSLADSTVTNFADLQTAITNATNNVETKITLGGDITDMTLYLEIPANKVIILDLNGKSLDRGLQSSISDGCVIKNEGKLTIQDSVGTGTITGGNSSDDFGGVYNSGIFTMTGGSITGNVGNGVYNSDVGTFIMAGGSIKDNESIYCGGVYNEGTFIMTGGSIAGNLSTGCGGVYNEGTFTMTGGSIAGNSGLFGGIYNMGVLNLGGTAVVMGNALNDVQNCSDCTINICTDETKKPADGMYVGLYGQLSVVNNATNGQQEYFFADKAGKSVIFESDTLKIADIPENNSVNFKITLSYNPEGGYITAPQYAESGEVEIEVHPADGYRLKSLTANDGEDIEINDNKFTMGTDPVTVKAEFEEMPTVPIKPLTPAKIDFAAISRLVKGVIDFISFKKTADGIKTVTILAFIFRIVAQILDKIF